MHMLSFGQIHPHFILSNSFSTTDSSGGYNAWLMLSCTVTTIGSYNFSRPSLEIIPKPWAEA